jgi:RNA polymerase sigma factor (sigma-70 family)
MDAIVCIALKTAVSAGSDTASKKILRGDLNLLPNLTTQTRTHWLNIYIIYDSRFLCATCTRPSETYKLYQSKMNEITAIREGIDAAFVKVYEGFHVKTFRFFLKRVRSSETAKELTQQTFIKLWSSRHTLQDSYSIDTQLFTIAGCVLIDHLRKQAALNKLHAVLGEERAGERIQPSPSSAAALERSDYLSVVVSKLPPVRKKVILLKTMHGFSNKEIAQELSISVKTVESHVTKAIRHIKSHSLLLLTLLAGLFIR